VVLEVRRRNGDRGVAMKEQRQGERQSGVGESSAAFTGRGGNDFSFRPTARG
jgi:hypothetical protein